MKKNKKKKNDNVYVISISPLNSRKRSAQKSINAYGSMEMNELDQKIRQAMGYDSWDHISAFYMGKPHRSPEIAMITPDGGGENSSLTIDELKLSQGSEMGYVYDFGDDIQSMLRVVEIMPDAVLL